jgi:hypothetical protein
VRGWFIQRAEDVSAAAQAILAFLVRLPGAQQ